MEKTQTTHWHETQSKIRHLEIKKKKENNNFCFSLLYSVQSQKTSIESLQQYLSRDFGLACCHSSMLIPASFPPHQKNPCFQFLQMFNSQTAQQRYLFSGFTLLADETMLRISGTAWILHRACTDPCMALWVLFML